MTKQWSVGAPVSYGHISNSILSAPVIYDF
jgi:hypothetical protein